MIPGNTPVSVPLTYGNIVLRDREHLVVEQHAPKARDERIVQVMLRCATVDHESDEVAVEGELPAAGRNRGGQRPTLVLC